MLRGCRGTFALSGQEGAFRLAPCQGNWDLCQGCESTFPSSLCQQSAMA